MINKLARTITSILPVDSNRTGSCNNCGECCKLPFRCTFLKTDEDGKGYCSAYKFRPLNCRKFPRTPQQLVPVADVCGFSFKTELAADAEENKTPSGFAADPIKNSG
jgi:Fe-S-cluster containining protein